MAESKEYVCECCGKPFTASANRQAKYCSKKCLDNTRKRKVAEAKRQNKAMLVALRTDCPNITEEYIAKRCEQIAHQQDTSVWTHDYAERQKARTLAMVQGKGI